MLTGKRRRIEQCQTLQDRAGLGGVIVVIHWLAHRFAGREDLRFGDGFGFRTRLREKITAQQRAGRLVKQYAAVPAVRHMRRINPLPCLLASRERLAISQTSALAVCMIVE